MGDQTYNGLTLEQLVSNNSHELTAHLLISERADRLHQAATHAAEVDQLRKHLDDAQRIGLAVLRAKRAGRKTIRVADLVED